MRKNIAFLLLLACLETLAAAQQLPRTVLPENYQLTLSPNFQTDKFDGDETITVRVAQPTSAITLNAAEITFGEATVTQNGSTQTAQAATDSKAETATLTVPQALAAGPATIHIRYTGILNNELRGFYLSQVGQRKYGVTQFEPADARRAYPSFDQPDMKATFDLTVVVDKGDMAISNGKVVSDTPGPGADKHTVKFSTTPKMSSYLLALAVGEFQCEAGQADGIPIRVCGTPEQKGRGHFALQAAEYSLSYYDRYFGIKYPYGKLDIIGVPDFSAGAMENVGCIIGRDILYFVDPRSSSYFLQKAVAEDGVAHEMAHQWFGDLVTMKWWDDFWLNEGFATWMSAKPIAAWKPEWNLATDDVQSAGQAMAVDSLSSTHPIHQEVETPAQALELADVISYNKTAAVLRMVEGYVGPAVFRKGVNSYLAKYAYGNTTAPDFWNAITAAAKKPADKVMTTFVMQPGVPLVSVSASCSNGNTKVEVSQTRYFRNRELLNAGSKELWQIPVCLKAGNQEKCELLTSKSQTLELTGCAPVYANAGARGYYHSGYDAANLRRLATGAEQDLSPAERVQLIDDAWAEVRVDRIHVGDFLALAESLKNDPTRAVSDELAQELQYVDQHLTTGADRQQYEAWVRQTFSPVGEQLGWTPQPNDSEEQRARRADLLTLVGEVGRDPKLAEFSSQLTEKALRGEAVDPTLIYPALNIATRNGDAALYDAIQKRAQSSGSPEEAFRFLRALGNFQKPALVERSLEYAVSSQVRSQDAPFLIGRLMGNPDTQDQAWDWIRQHWSQVEAKLTNFSTGAVVDGAGSFCDAGHKQQVQDFFSQHPIPSAQRTLQQSLEFIGNCVDLKQQQEPNLASWLQQQGGGREAQ
ncbi:MAG TPA: M1 family metallopeptidase [Terriglobales bacterium]|nr:M1 family metallopeptidase [Terriglobales bacterium]